MAAVEELLRSEEDGSVSFGNHTLRQKAKLEDYRHGANLLKVKTYSAITRLEKDGLFLYESVPGTSVQHFAETADGVDFLVEGAEDAQITIGLADETDYEVTIGDENVGIMKTGLGGKLSMSVELANVGEVHVRVKRV